jgi:hypothetical protein
MRNDDAETAAGTHLVDRIREAILEEDDEKIIGVYRENERFLESPDVLTSVEQRRIALARERVRALADLHAAFARKSPDEIVRVFVRHSDLLESSRNFGRDERRRVTEARRAYLLNELRAAVQAKDVYRIERAGQRAVEDGCLLSDADHAALQHARHTALALRHLKNAIGDDDDAAIIEAYQADLLDDCQQVTPQDMERVHLAYNRLHRWHALRRALARKDDLAVASLYERPLFDGYRLMSPEQRERCELAAQRAGAFQRLQQALLTDDPEQIVRAYDEKMIGSSAWLTPTQRKRIQDACYQVNLLAAWKSGDRAAIADAYRTLTQAHAVVPDGVSEEALSGAARQTELVARFRAVLHSVEGSDEEIARLGDRLLDLVPGLLTEEERAKVLRSKVKVGARSRLLRAAASGDNQRVTMVYQHLLSIAEDVAVKDPDGPGQELDRSDVESSSSL